MLPRLNPLVSVRTPQQEKSEEEDEADDVLDGLVLRIVIDVRFDTEARKPKWQLVTDLAVPAERVQADGRVLARTADACSRILHMSCNQATQRAIKQYNELPSAATDAWCEEGPGTTT